MANRRDVLTAGLAGAVALGLSGSLSAAVGRPLKILVMGGTGFLGPHFVAAARARGHELTLFNRGKTNPKLFKNRSDIEQLHGDRKLDLKALQGRKWDAVLDTSAYVPADVTRSARLLAKNVGQYLIVSTVSVYAKLDRPGMDEGAPLVTLPDPTVETVTNETYGGLKALSEKAAEKAMPGRVTVVRPGLIVGPGDTSDRFTYWPVRVARGGEVLAPDSPEAPTQFIDVRDLAAFLLRLIEDRRFGIFNADAFPGELTMGKLLGACHRAGIGARTERCAEPPCPTVDPMPSTITWVPTAFLLKQNVSPWSDLPCWMPATGDEAGFGRVSVARAIGAGLRFRPLDVTVGDTLAWWASLPAERRRTLKAGITPEREAAVLKAWHANSPG